MAKKKKEEKVEVTTSDNILLGNVDESKIKGDLEKYVDEKISKVFIDELDKANRKLLREKSKKIFIKNIIIILLLIIIAGLVYLLYRNNYFDRFFNKNNTVIEEKIEKEEEKKEEVKKPTLDELKKEYGSLIDNYVINDTCNYLNDFYNSNLTSNLKKYLTLNTIDFNSLKVEEDYQIIANDTFKLAYERLFNDNGYDIGGFDYNGNNIRYVSLLNSYMTTSVLKKDESLIKREISDITKDGEKIIITTYEGIVEDGKLYNIINNKQVEEYKGDSLLKYKDYLNKVVYVFKDNKLIDFGK